MKMEAQVKATHHDIKQNLFALLITSASTFSIIMNKNHTASGQFNLCDMHVTERNISKSMVANGGLLVPFQYFITTSSKPFEMSPLWPWYLKAKGVQRKVKG